MSKKPLSSCCERPAKVNMVARAIEGATRFMELCMPEPNTGCWLWGGPSNGHGYGSFFYKGRLTGAHRYSHETFIGPIPNGYDVDHLCRVRCCVNPAHLEAVTRRENILRGVSKVAQRASQTHCKNGHPFSLDNTSITRRGSRVCKTCRAAYARKNRPNKEHWVEYRRKRREAGNIVGKEKK